jgi:hypothetical protein
MRLRHVLALLLLVTPTCGCGSKISRSNYYRVQYGMKEGEVEELLGPPHAVSEAPSTTRPVMRSVQTWKRGDLVIRVVFVRGVVVGRSADGIPAEAPSIQKVSNTPT